MSSQTLREKYDAKLLPRAVNKAIRAEIPGGDEALAALELAHGFLRRAGVRNAADSDLPQARMYMAVLAIVDAMEDEVRQRYDIPPAKDRDDDRRRGKENS
jgi:hypothetical protein